MKNERIKFHKQIVFTNTKLSGSYKYKEIFQIYPIEGEGYPYSEHQTQFPNYLELTTSKGDNVTIQTPYPEGDDLISRLAPPIIKQDLIINLLSTCTNHLFYRNEISGGMWALPLIKRSKTENKELESQWCFPIYGSKKTGENNVIINFSATDLPPIPQVKFKSYYVDKVDSDESFSGPIKFPTIIDGFLFSYFNLDDNDKMFINRAMHHLSNGIKIKSTKKSLSLISLFTSLETMVDLENMDFEPESCECCGQQKFKVSAKFRNFLTKYVASKSKAKFNKLYSLRSKIVHTGKLLDTEFLYNEASKETKKEEELKIVEVIQICRISIVNWIIQKQLKKEEAEHNTQR